MKILGINETSHDASISFIDNEEILFAAHAERYTKKKNEWYISNDLVQGALKYGYPDAIAYYEKPALKFSRLLLSGGLADWNPQCKIDNVPVYRFKHHQSHASAGYFTSPFREAVVVVLDAIGEWETSTIWLGKNNKLKQIFKKRYPFSFGLFYSAFTNLIGLKPNEEEYIMMGMAGYGDPEKYYYKVNSYFPDIYTQKYNFHKGIFDWNESIKDQDKFDIAAAVQKVYEERLSEFMWMAKRMSGQNNLVFMGGCALNSKANTMLWKIFKDVWIMPNPGDAGSSLGAAAALYGKHINWNGPYLGHNIESNYPVEKIYNQIVNNKVAAVASGRAEYGPRALGNRSILADPRDPNIKNEVNKIKKRELFRPFAPVVLEEYAQEWFDMTYTSPYMQYTPKCLKPDVIPSVVHIDGTSRVQTVNEKQHPGLYKLLRKWYDYSGVPVLLNTSLNIKGEPLLNDEEDIVRWQKTYGVQIIS